MLKRVLVKFQGGILVQFLVKQACDGFETTDLNGRKRSARLSLSKLNSLSNSLSKLSPLFTTLRQAMLAESGSILTGFFEKDYKDRVPAF